MADADRADTAARTPAQWYSLIFGAVLLLAGILGFFANSDFDVGSNVDGNKLIFFEVNGWHNIIHIASGIAGLALASRADTARLFALGFGAVYLLVTLWGLIDGEDILFGVAPINPADNILHLAISLAGIAAGLASSTKPRGQAATA
jgi:energy-coupling factor transporter transmembrane protein EcfT